MLGIPLSAVLVGVLRGLFGGAVFETVLLGPGLFLCGAIVGAVCGVRRISATRCGG